LRVQLPVGFARVLDASADPSHDGARHLDDRRDEVRAAVRRTVRAKLEVANPKYLDT